MKLLKTLVLSLVLALSSQANAGWLIGKHDGINSGNGRITILSSNAYDTGGFAIRVEGGQGACANAKWIVFPVPDENVDSWKHSFEVAKTAFLHGYKVNIYNYDDDRCDNAQFIQLVRP